MELMIKEMDENGIALGVAVARESKWGGAAKNEDLPGLLAEHYLRPAAVGNQNIHIREILCNVIYIHGIGIFNAIFPATVLSADHTEGSCGYVSGNGNQTGLPAGYYVQQCS